MEYPFLSVSVNGRVSIATNDVTIKKLFKIASKDVTTAENIKLNSTMYDVEQVLNMVIDSPTGARKDLHDSFIKSVWNSDGNEYREMVWCLAWAIYASSELSISPLNVFFEGIFESICFFKNYDDIESFVNGIRGARVYKAYKKETKIPIFARVPIGDIENIVTSCNEDTVAHRKKIDDIQGDYELSIKQEYMSMEQNLNGSVYAIAQSAKESLTQLATQLESSDDLLQKTRKELEAAKKKLDELESDEYRKNIGENFFTSLIDDYIKPYEDSDDQSTRLRIYNELWNFVSGTNGIPKDIKERVKRFRLPIKKKQVPTTVVNIKELNGTALGSANQSFGDNTPKLES